MIVPLLAEEEEGGEGGFVEVEGGREVLVLLLVLVPVLVLVLLVVLLLRLSLQLPLRLAVSWPGVRMLCDDSRRRFRPLLARNQTQMAGAGHPIVLPPLVIHWLGWCGT